MMQLIRNIVAHVGKYRRLTTPEKSQILQTVAFLAREAANLANSLESSMCHGYSTNTWKQSATSATNKETLGIQSVSLSERFLDAAPGSESSNGCD